jgi:hypothetical protein
MKFSANKKYVIKVFLIRGLLMSLDFPCFYSIFKKFAIYLIRPGFEAGPRPRPIWAKPGRAWAWLRPDRPAGPRYN